MNTENFAGKNQHQLGRIGLRAARCVVLVGVFAASSWAAAAGGASVFNKGDSVEIAPWTPDIVTAIDEYVPQPSFSFGRFNLDHFAAANSLDQQGAVTAQLASGGIVVAGLVPDGVSGGFCGDGTKLCSIGLVKYNTIGQRLTWPNAGANGRFSNNYVVFPGGSSSSQYQYLRDISVRGSFIDVMVDQPDSFHAAGTLGYRNVRIYTFRDDGSFLSSYSAFGASATNGNDMEDFYGAQMIQINSTTIIVGATAYDSIGSYIAVARMSILASGALTQDDTWGSPYGGGNSFTRIVRYFPPSTLCAGPPCKATAGYVARQEGFATATDFYVTGSVLVNGNDFDAVTLKISSATGDLKTEFSSDGWARTSFDQPNSNLKDIGAGLYVYQDDVYIAAQVAQKCHDGIGMAKINGATGGFITAFGGTGKIVFGGQGNAALCFAGNNATTPFAISATGGRIGVVGTQASSFLVGGGTSFNPMLAVVNAVNGQVLDIDSHPVLRADGTRFGDAVLYGIYGGPSPTSPFTVSGNGRDTTAGNTLSYLTGRFIPVSSDRIFASGFD